MDTEQAPFSKGALVAFRKRLIEAQMDRRLIERTIEIAGQNQGFGPRALRAALDSSPLWGSGRIEDTYNLVGHALKKVLRVVADQHERDLVEVAKEAGAELICGSSLKAALLLELRQRQQTPQGRAKLRERVAVENTLAHVSRWQGRRARYRGLRKNLFDLRRCAVVHNLHVLARSQHLLAEFQDAA